MLSVFGSLMDRPIIKPMIEPYYDKMLQMAEDEILLVEAIVNESAIDAKGMAIPTLCFIFCLNYRDTN